MPRSIKNTTPTPISVAPAPIVEPTPLIVLQPHGDDVQFNAYGLEIADIVNALRLAIVHVVGKPDGITVIDEPICAAVSVLPSSFTTAPPSGDEGPSAIATMTCETFSARMASSAEAASRVGPYFSSATARSVETRTAICMAS